MGDFENIKSGDKPVLNNANNNDSFNCSNYKSCNGVKRVNKMSLNMYYVDILTLTLRQATYQNECVINM